MSNKVSLNVKGHNSSQKVLGRICQSQAVSIDVISKGGSPVLIEGPMDQFKWDEIMAISGLVVDSICLLDEYAGMKVSMHQKIEFMNSAWNPVVELRTEEISQVGIEVLQSVCELTMHKLMPHVEDVQDMLLPDLCDSVNLQIDELVTGFLERRGGCKINDEIQFDVGNKTACKIKTKAKPNKSNFTPVCEILEGKFTGFDAEDRVFYFRQQAGGKMSIVYDSGDLDVMDIASYQKSGREYKVAVNKTVQKNGNPLYAYLRIHLDEDSLP